MYTSFIARVLFYERSLSQLQVVDLCPPRQSIEPNKHHDNVGYQLEIDEVLLPPRSVFSGAGIGNLTRIPWLEAKDNKLYTIPACYSWWTVTVPPRLLLLAKQSCYLLSLTAQKFYWFSRS